MATSLADAIVSKIFGEFSENRLVVVENYDGFLVRDDVKLLLVYNNLKIEEGDSLKLRLWWENNVKEEILNENSLLRFIFVKTKEFSLIDDIAQYADQSRLSARSLFPRYKWEIIKDQPIDVLEHLFKQRGRVSIDELQTLRIIADYEAQYKKGYRKH